MDTIFTKIIKGEIPCHKVYEDEQIIGFLDIHPITQGHTLIVTKQQVDQFTDLTSESFESLMSVVHGFSQHLKQKLGCQRVVVRIEGFDVPHVHVHLVPVNAEHESYREGRFDEEPDHTSLAETATMLRI